MSGEKKILEKLFLGKKEVITDPITSEKKILYSNNLSKFILWILILGAIIFFSTLYFTNDRGLSFTSNQQIKDLTSNNPKISKDGTIRLLKRTDSLQKELDKYKLYVNNISNVINGEVSASHDSLVKVDELIPIAEHELNKDSIAPSKEDIEFRTEIIEDGFSTVAITTDDLNKKEENIILFPPVKGIITSKYNITEEHLALDIACDEGDPVKATMDGFIIFSDWTSDGGYVLVLQHKQNILSVYKHNSQLYKKQGDVVQAGDVIAAAGSSGELSIGAHLHFELWIEGYSVDPETYIDF